MLKTVDAIVEALGGTGSAAALIGVGKSTVSNWKARGRIPPENFVALSKALAKKGKRPAPTAFGFRSTGEARA